MRDLPAVDLHPAGEFAHLLVERRRQLVHEIAATGMRSPSRFTSNSERAKASVPSGGMEEGDASCRAVLDQQQIVRLDVQVVAAEAPRRVVEKVESSISAGSASRDRPSRSTASGFLDHREGAHFRRRGNHVLARDLHAFSGGIELEAVVRALDDVADQLAHRQRRRRWQQRSSSATAVPSSLGERRTGSSRISALERARDLVVPGGDVPGITDEHERPLWLSQLPEEQQNAERGPGGVQPGVDAGGLKGISRRIPQTTNAARDGSGMMRSA